MIQFRPDTSFPYLKIAREHGVPYGEVIRFVDNTEQAGGRIYLSVDDFLDWERAACLAWIAERNRRLS